MSAKSSSNAAPAAAMYLAAGLGERMRPLTDDRPKPLIQVAGRPLIDIALDTLAAAGVVRVVVNLHYRGQMIRQHLRTRRQPEIIYSDESDLLLGPGGGVVKALPLLGGGPFYVHNCDSLWRDGIASTLVRMSKVFDPLRMDALLLLAPLRHAIGFDGPGDYFMAADGALTRNSARRTAPYAYCGVMLCQPRLFAEPPPGAFSTVALWDRAERAGRLFGLAHDVSWFHIGTPQALARAEQLLAKP